MARLFDDAQDQRLQVASAPTIAVPFAMVAWFNSDDILSYQEIIRVSSAGGHFYELYIRGFDGSVAVGLAAGGGDTGAFTTTQAAGNTWNHACGIFISATDRDVYLNAGGKATSVGDRSPNAPDEMSIATRFGGGGDQMSGMLAEVAIYDLSGWPGASASDKADNFAAIAPPSLALGYSPLFYLLGLLAYWPLIRDEDQDRVGGYDLTAVNAPTIGAHPPVLYPAPTHLAHISAVAPPVGPFLTTYAGYSVPVG